MVLVLEGQVEEDKVHLGVDKQQMCNHIAWRLKYNLQLVFDHI